MKILILSDDFPPEHQGGAGIIAHRIARQFSLLGHAVSVACAGTGASGTGTLDGMTVHRLRSHYAERFRAYLSLYNPRTIPHLKRIISEIKPDVVFAHNIHQHLSYHSLKIVHDTGIPVFLTCHDVMPFAYGKLTAFISPDDLTVRDDYDYRLSPLVSLRQQRLRYFPLRNMLIRGYLKRNVQQIISVSDALGQALAANRISNVRTIHNGIDPGEMRVSEERVQDFNRRFNLGGKKAILFGGRLSYLKGAVHLLRAFNKVAARVPEAVLLIIGNREGYGRDIARVAQGLGIDGRVVFTGWIEGDDLKSAYAACSVVAVPSVCFDSFPVVILEAMAAARPVIATCFGGSREAVLDTETGCIVNPLDIDGMGERIAGLLGNTDVCRRMGEAGRRRVQELFSLDRCARHYLALPGNTR